MEPPGIIGIGEKSHLQQHSGNVGREQDIEAGIAMSATQHRAGRRKFRQQIFCKGRRMGLCLALDEIFQNAADNLGPAGFNRYFPVVLVSFLVDAALAAF